MFTTEQLGLIKKDPEFINKDGTHKNDARTGEPYKHTAFMSIAGKRWNELDEKKRAVYEKMAEADKIRHEHEMEEWKANDEEFYTKANGTKSNAGLESKSKIIESPRFIDEEEASPVRKIMSKKRQSKLSK